MSEIECPLRARVLTMHYSDTILYRSLLARFPGPVQALTARTSSVIGSHDAHNLVVWLNSLTPTIAELTAVTVNSSCEIRLALLAMSDTPDAFALLLSRASEKLLKLRQASDDISGCFEGYALELSAATKSLDDSLGKKVARRANLQQACIHLQNGIHKTRMRVSQTDNAIEELNGIHKVAERQRIYARSKLGMLRIAHHATRLFGTAENRALCKAQKESLLSANVVRRIRRDRDNLIRRRRCEVGDLAHLATKEITERHTLACCNADITNLRHTSRDVRIIADALHEISVAWGSVARTFDAITSSCCGGSTAEGVLELWQTASVLTRSFLEGHLDSNSILLSAVQETRT